MTVLAITRFCFRQSALTRCIAAMVMVGLFGMALGEPAKAQQQDFPELVSGLNAANLEIEQLRAEIARMKTELEAATRDRALQEENHKKLVSDYGSLERSCTKVTGDLKTKTSELSACERKVTPAVLLEDCSLLKVEVQNLTSRNGVIQNDLEGCRQELIALQKCAGTGCAPVEVPEIPLLRACEQEKNNLSLTLDTCKQKGASDLFVCEGDRTTLTTKLEKCEARETQVVFPMGICGAIRLEVGQSSIRVSGTLASEAERTDLLDRLASENPQMELQSEGLDVSETCRQPIGRSGFTVDMDGQSAVLNTMWEIRDRNSLLPESRCAEIGAKIDELQAGAADVGPLELRQFWVLGADGQPLACRKEEGEWVSRPRSPTESTDRLPVVRLRR